MRHLLSSRRGVRLAGAAALAVAALGLLAPASDGAGLLIAEGGLGGVLEIKEHDVRVTINNGIAVTEVVQVFRNTENRQVEALYTFPVPKGASVADFSMWIEGREMVGEVVEKERARQIYESYKPRRKDPGLLEQTDYKTFEMRIFPIGAGAEQKVRLRYYQELDVDDDWATYVYPLATTTESRGRAVSTRAGKFSLTVDARSAVPIVGMESPSHQDAFVIAHHAEGYFQAGLETGRGDLGRDFVVAYRLSRPKSGIDVLTSKPPGDDGYLCLTLTAGEELAEPASGADYAFVLDVSGSMAETSKLGLSRDAIAAFSDVLGEGDRFDIITFNVAPKALFGALREVGADAKVQAARFLASQEARGGTDLRTAIAAAYRLAEAPRTLNVVIVSDGLTDQRDRTTLLEMSRSRPPTARLFCIGVGSEVNRGLLEQLAENTGGLASFLSAGDDFDRQARAFRRKVTRPAASDLALAVDGGGVYDVEPVTLPPLYHGTPLRVYARYRSPGPAGVTVRGRVGGKDVAWTANVLLPERQDTDPEIERMWAWHRVDRLLKEADRTGSREGVAGEIVRLGEAYSIATEHTSFIVLENDAEYKRWSIDRRSSLRLARDREANQVLARRLEALREKAVAKIGPQTGPIVSEPTETGSTAASRSQPAPQPSGGFHLPHFGGGPVGPAGIVVAAGVVLAEWLRRRKARR